MPRTRTTAPLLLAALLSLDGCDPSTDEHSEHCDNWSYEHGTCGPPWNADEDPAWQECAIGDDQSPIDIHDTVLDGALAPLDIRYTADDHPTLHNNGHTLQVDYTGGTLTLGEKQLRSLQFHVHVPAEHAVDGKRAAMEVHIVHADEAGNPAAVVALRFDEGAQNPVLAEAWRDAPADKGDATVDASLDISALLPEHTDYWTYAGSLTTPPCSEGLRWFVLEQIGTVSKAQISTVTDRVGSNARDLQPINNRPIVEHRS